MDHEVDLDLVATAIRASYIMRVRVKGGHWRKYTPGTRQNGFWQEAASICLRHGFDPDLHVRALIEQQKNSYPNMLVGERAIARTRAFMGTEARDELMLLESYLARLQGCLRVGENLVGILTNSHNGFSPSFRFCVAVRAGLPGIASQFREAARAELRLRPKMKTLLGRMLPMTFAEVLDDGNDPAATPVADNPLSSRSGYDPGRGVPR
jgi:hypothetical protein